MSRASHRNTGAISKNDTASTGNPAPSEPCVVAIHPSTSGAVDPPAIPKKNAAPPDLDIYFRDNVIGGPGSFYMVARNLDGFSKSVLHKLVLEIAGIDLRRGPNG